MKMAGRDTYGKGGEPAAPSVMLAPLAGITDLPFRKLVHSFGADLVVSEMVASHDLLNARPGAREKAELGFDQAATAVQLAGREPYWMAEAAKHAEAAGARIIDINMGCPAKKVTGGLSGSALLRDLDLAISLVRAVVAAVGVPVTLKTRLGWDESSLNAAELARRAEAEGITRLTIHGRTRCQFYKGQADWAAIKPIVDAVNIPVIANGDITDLASARAALAASGAAGIMVGRGAQGRPWLLNQLRAQLRGAPMPAAPTRAEMTKMVQGHYAEMIDFYGPKLGLRVARKHLGWYMDEIGAPKPARHAVLTASDPGHVRALLAQCFENAEHTVAA